MPLLWTRSNWTQLTWSNALSQRLLLQVTHGLGQVRGRIEALSDTLQRQVKADLLAEELAFSAKIDKWRFNDETLGATLRANGHQAGPLSGKMALLALAIAETGRRALVNAESYPNVGQLKSWQPEATLYAGERDSRVPPDWRDDARLTRDEEAGFACLPSAQIDAAMKIFGQILTNNAPHDHAAQAAAMHLMFALIRPFVRANGYVARLMTQVVLQRATPGIPVTVPLSYVLHENREAYFALLGKCAWEASDITDFVVWHHQMMLKAVQRGLVNVRRAEVAQRLKVADRRLSAVQHQAVGLLLARMPAPIGVVDLMGESGRGRSAAFRQLKGLEGLGIVRGSGPAKHRVYALTREWQFEARVI
ncbi:MAG: DUF4172 domain-containing protein [Deltaproteobacteria bacterium]